MKQLLIGLLMSVAVINVTGGEKGKLDPVQKKYKNKIDTEMKRHTKTMGSIKKLMIKDYQKLFNKAMQQKDLDKATEYKEKIDSLQNTGTSKTAMGMKNEDLYYGIPLAPGQSRMVSKLLGTSWTVWGPNAIVTFEASGAALYKNGEKLANTKWKILDENKRQVHWSGGTGNTIFVFDRNFKTFNILGADGKPTQYVGKQVKK